MCEYPSVLFRHEEIHGENFFSVLGSLLFAPGGQTVPARLVESEQNRGIHVIKAFPDESKNPIVEGSAV